MSPEQQELIREKTEQLERLQRETLDARTRADLLQGMCNRVYAELRDLNGGWELDSYRAWGEQDDVPVLQ